MTVVPLIYLLDTSGSMSGSRIKKINQIMKKTFNDLKCVINNEEYVIKVAVLSFATCCQWITCGLTDVEKIQWEDLDAEGMTSLGLAFEELNNVLRKEKLLKIENNQRMLRPVIILFTDGYPTDLYEDKLNQLKKNDLFSKSLKFAIGLDNEINREVLIEFVESNNCLIAEKDFDIICQNINSISMVSAQYNIEHSSNNLIRNSVADSEKIISIINANINTDDNDSCEYIGG